MAKKSKTQRAKASAVRAQKKQQREQEALVEKSVVEKEQERPNRGLFRRKDESQTNSDTKATSKKGDSKAIAKKAETKPAKKEEKPKKKRFQFFRDVKAEMKRVTWPTRSDVLRWSGVVVVALIFFGVFVAILDNIIITPILVFISGLGA